MLWQATKERQNCCIMNIWRKSDPIHVFLTVFKEPLAFKTSIIYHRHNLDDAGSKCSASPHAHATPPLLVHFPRALCSPKNILWSRENAAGKDRPRRPSALTAHTAVVIFMRTKFDEFPVHKCTGHIPDHPVSSSIPATAHLSSSKKKRKELQQKCAMAPSSSSIKIT